MTLEEFLKLFPQGQPKRARKRAVELHSRTNVHEPRPQDVAVYSGEPLPTSDSPLLPTPVLTPTQADVARYVENARKQTEEQRLARQDYARRAYEDRLAEVARYRQELQQSGEEYVKGLSKRNAMKPPDATSARKK